MTSFITKILIATHDDVPFVWLLDFMIKTKIIVHFFFYLRSTSYAKILSSKQDKQPFKLFAFEHS